MILELKKVEKGEYIAILTDPYGSFRHKVKATQTGYIINVNQSPIVYQGDAIFHISKENRVPIFGICFFPCLCEYRSTRRYSHPPGLPSFVGTASNPSAVPLT